MEYPSGRDDWKGGSSPDTAMVSADFQWITDGITVTDTRKHDVEFPPGFPLVFNDYHFSASVDVPDNYHDYLEVSLVDHGTGNLKIGSSRVPIAAGDVILIGPDQLHTVEAGNESDLFVKSVYFLSELVFSPGDTDSNFDWLRPFYDQRFRCNPVITRARTGTLTNHIEELVQTRKKSTRYRNLEARLGLLRVLLDARREIESQHPIEGTGLTGGNQERLNRVLNWMRKNFQDGITLNDAAEIACVSPQHFCRFFKNAVGHTFTEHLSRIRVAHAKQLLVQGDLRSTDIAFEVGFGSQSNFFRTFRRVTGASPHEFLTEDGSEGS